MVNNVQPVQALSRGVHDILCLNQKSFGLVPQFSHVVKLKAILTRHLICILKILLKNWKAPFTLFLNAVCKSYAQVLCNIREQVLTRNKKVVEFNIFQVTFEVLQEMLKAISQIWDLPVTVFRSGAAGMEERGLGVIGAEFSQGRIFFFTQMHKVLEQL